MAPHTRTTPREFEQYLAWQVGLAAGLTYDPEFSARMTAARRRYEAWLAGDPHWREAAEDSG